MSTRLLAVPTSVAAILSWFFRETITHWFFGKVVDEMNGNVEMLVEYGIPTVFAAATFLLLWDGSAVPNPFARKISLRDAASRLYTKFRGTTIGGLMEGPSGTTPDGILDYAASHILHHLPVEVKRPPSTKWEPLDPLAVGGLTVSGGATGLRFVGSNDVIFTEPRLKRKDLERLIREYEPQAHQPARFG
jgi:hypothetical protein